MPTDARPRTWQLLLAFAVIYFVWGSTFLAIRVGVREVPPFLLAAIRFLIAGMAHVNPVIAVLLGYFLGGEALGIRTVLGTFLVLVGVIVITTAPAKRGEVKPFGEELGEAG